MDRAQVLRWQRRPIFAQPRWGRKRDSSIVCPFGNNLNVGVKPTVGLVSQDGTIPIAHSQDTAESFYSCWSYAGRQTCRALDVQWIFERTDVAGFGLRSGAAIKPRTQPQFLGSVPPEPPDAGICATLTTAAAPKLVNGRAKTSHHIGSGKPFIQ